jgi:hypothetical protein
MNRFAWGIIKMFVFSTVFAALISCAGKPGARNVIVAPDTSPVEEKSFQIENFKGKDEGGEIPLWVSLCLNGNIRELESFEQYQDYHVFTGRHEGPNFTALSHWVNGFTPDLDFPRLAAARIESRFLSANPLPDEAYGAFFVTLIRAVSDAPWTGAFREDDFWIFKRYDEPEEEAYEFFVLVKISKPDFASQFDTIFRSVRPSPQPTREQMNAVNRVKERFYEGF